MTNLLAAEGSQSVSAASGVFALHNSAATPSILPDGSDAPGSVDPALSGEHVGDMGGSVHHR